MGLFVGTGDQDNYVKIVTAANGGSGGIQFTKEVGGTVTVRPGANVTLPGPDYVDLYLRIDPDAATVQPRYSVTAGGVTGPLTDLGGSEPVPSGWFTGSTGLAVGIISTSSGPGVPFPATWDFIEAVPETVTDPSAIAQDTFTRTVTNSLGDGGRRRAVDGGGGRCRQLRREWGKRHRGHPRRDTAAGGSPGTGVGPGRGRRRSPSPSPMPPPARGTFFGYLLLRRQAGGAYYRVGLYVDLRRARCSSGARPAPAPTCSPTSIPASASPPGIRSCSGSRPRGLAPPRSGPGPGSRGPPSPTSWQATATDATAGLQQAGSVGIRTVNTTSTATTLRFDDLLGKELRPRAATARHLAVPGPLRAPPPGGVLRPGGREVLPGRRAQGARLTRSTTPPPTPGATSPPCRSPWTTSRRWWWGARSTTWVAWRRWPGPASAQVYIYDPATNSFTQGAPMPPGRERGAGGVAVHQGKIYYAGGLNGGFAKPWFDVYDPAANTWTQLPNMPVARDHFQAQVANGKFWVTGGRDTAINSTITSTIAYDFSTGTWQTGFAPLPTARGGFASAVLGDEILVIGGEGGGTTFNTVEAYNTTTEHLANPGPHAHRSPRDPGGRVQRRGLRRRRRNDPGRWRTDRRPRGVLPDGAPTPCQPPPSSAIAQDTFTRTVTDSWGTADVGGPWTVVAGAAANFDVNGASGTVATPGGSQQQAAHLGQVSVRDVDAAGRDDLPRCPHRLGELLRLPPPPPTGRRRVLPGGAVRHLRRARCSSGARPAPGPNCSPTSITGLSFAAGDTFLLRVQAEGAAPTTIRARAWEQGTAEPASWQATATDATAGLQQAGSVGIRTVNTTSTATTLRFDDLAATSI